jgi:hypothetical protein
MRRLLAACLLATAGSGAAADWRFGEALTVSPGRPGVYPHLEAAGRASLAVDAAGTVAIVWEDNRSGRAQVYLAAKPSGEAAFPAPVAVSSDRGDAYEPAVAAAGRGRWLVVWEQDGAVWARVAGGGAMGTPSLLSESGGRQPTLAAGPGGELFAAWSGRVEEGGNGVVVARLALKGEGIDVVWRRPVEQGTPVAPQLYPALGISGQGVTVAWEDRRHGHTRLYASRMADPQAGFSAPGLVNELRQGADTPYGRGSGVTRIALDARDGTLAAVWMDKRQFQGGYDVYAALGAGKEGLPGTNELAQDLFGENQPQWHPDIAVSADGRIVAAWDDPRDGSPDLWFSWRQGAGEWSADITFDGGSGPGAETHPVIAFGPDGRLHLAWLARPVDGSPAIRYAVAEWRD